MTYIMPITFVSIDLSVAVLCHRLHRRGRSQDREGASSRQCFHRHAVALQGPVEKQVDRGPVAVMHL